MSDKIYLVEFNQDAESTLNLINIDLLDSVARFRRQAIMNFGRDDSGWKVIGWAHTQQDAHAFAEDFLHTYYSEYPHRFPAKATSTSNLSEGRRHGYDPSTKILPRQTYK